MHSTPSPTVNSNAVSANSETLIGEADRRGDREMLKKLTTEKLQIDRRLREH
jgi:hypothetical protein